MKSNFTICRIIISFMIIHVLSGCSVSIFRPSLATVTPPMAAATQTSIETNMSDPMSIRTQTPAIIPDWQLVWSDEFDGKSIDRSVWSFEIGPSNDNAHYYTDRPENARVVDGKLQIIALEESINGYGYSSALLKTSSSVNWRYGRIEARIKLPATNGFVPAFWMLPSDDLYGWWPASGEIDIMEHPTNKVDLVYGTVHTEAYNVFAGSSGRGSTLQVTDTETEFHIFAIEWTEDKIEFYVDEQNYFTFPNGQGGIEEWPFDQPFYLILNLAVGGSWVGDPDAASFFPAVMEVDYVRVYQHISDISIYGPDFLTSNSKAVSYSMPAIEGLIYQWHIPEGAQIVYGQNTPQIVVDWKTIGGNIELELVSGDSTDHIYFPVEVSANLLMNSGFEKGAKYWQRTVSSAAEAEFRITSDNVYAGTSTVFINVEKPGVNSWDVQLSQRNVFLEPGSPYVLGLWAKAEGTNPKINLAIVNSNDFTLYAIQTVELSNEWGYYEMTFFVPTNTTASFNIDMGEFPGSYYFDNIAITEP